MSEEIEKAEEAVEIPTFSKEFENKFNGFLDTADNALSQEETEADQEGTVCSVTFNKGGLGLTYRVHRQSDQSRFSVECFVVGADGKRASDIFTSKGCLKKTDYGSIAHYAKSDYGSITQCSQGSGLSAAQGILIEMQNLILAMFQNYEFMSKPDNNSLVRTIQSELAKQHAKAKVVSAKYESWTDKLMYQKFGRDGLGRLELKGRRKTDEEAHKELLALFKQERPEGPFGEEFMKNLGYGVKEKPEKDNEIDESFFEPKKPLFKTFFAWLKAFIDKVLHFGRKKDSGNISFSDDEDELDNKDDKLERIFESQWDEEMDEDDRKALQENPREAFDKAIKYEIRMSSAVQKDKKTHDRLKDEKTVIKGV